MKNLKGSRRLTVSSLAVLVVLYISLSWALADTSPPLEEWNSTFGGSGYDYGGSGQETSDGGYIMTGSIYSEGIHAVYLVKTDSQGREEWSSTFEGNFGSSVEQTSDGGYILIGATDFRDGSVFLVKVDSQGSEEWSRTFGGLEGDGGRSVRETSDGGYIIAGYTYSFGAGEGDVYLVKTDSEGLEEWSRTFGGSGVDGGYSVQETSDGGYILTGAIYSEGTHDVYLVKTDSQGSEEWSTTFGGSDFDIGSSLQETSDGGYIIAGHTLSFGAGEGDVYLVKTDSEGLEEWSRTFGGSDYDYGYWVQETSDGGYIITGVTVSFGAGEGDVYLVKTDSEGLEEWSTTFGGSELDGGSYVQETSDGGYIIAGTTNSSGAGGTDFYLVKVGSQESEREEDPFTPPIPPLPPILSNLAIAPADVERGDEVTISLDIENIDSQSFTYIVTMQIGELTLLIDIELGAYESKTVSRTITQDIPGDYSVTVDGLTGNFTVKTPPKPAEFEFSNLRIFYPGVTPPEVEKDQTVTVTVSIEAENVGELEGSRTVELKVDGEVIDSKEATLRGGASATILFELTRGEGTYEVEVEGFTESFMVNAKPEPEPGGIPGFPYVSIIIGLLIALVLHLRNQS